MGAVAGFDIDLRYGEAREDAFVHVLLRSRVEVKSDKRSLATGNVFIEFGQGFGDSHRPSGIEITTAEWWAIEIPGRLWILVDVERLRSLVAKAKAENRTAPGGDNGNVGALVPLAWLVSE